MLRRSSASFSRLSVSLKGKPVLMFSYASHSPQPLNTSKNVTFRKNFSPCCAPGDRTCQANATGPSWQRFSTMGVGARNSAACGCATSKAARAGFCKLRTHALRATAATNAPDRGADLGKVQEWLGHANVSTTRFYDRRRSRPEDSSTFHVAPRLLCASRGLKQTIALSTSVALAGENVPTADWTKVQ
jgi:hypothetical protein